MSRDLPSQGAFDEAVAIINDLPDLPRSLRYYDDFLERYHSIRDLSENEIWDLTTDGEKYKLDFNNINQSIKFLLKHCIIDFFDRFDPTTVKINGISLLSCAKVHDINFFVLSITAHPSEFRGLWNHFYRKELPTGTVASLKAYIDTLCRLSIGVWHPGLESFASTMVLYGGYDPYRVVRTGDCFIPIDQQARLIRFFDDLSISLTRVTRRFSRLLKSVPNSS